MRQLIDYSRRSIRAGCGGSDAARVTTVPVEAAAMPIKATAAETTIEGDLETNNGLLADVLAKEVVAPMTAAKPMFGEATDRRRSRKIQRNSKKSQKL